MKNITKILDAIYNKVFFISAFLNILIEDVYISQLFKKLFI